MNTSDFDIQKGAEREPETPNLPEILYNMDDGVKEYYTDTNEPFLCAHDYIVIEKANSSPYFLQSTFFDLPYKQEALNSCMVPFTMMISPFSTKSQITSINKPEKCPTCRSVPNSLTVETGRGYQCNICSSNFQLIDPTPVQFPSIEFVSKEGTLIPPVTSFVIDISTGQLALFAIDALSELFKTEDFQLINRKVSIFVIADGIVTFKKNSGGQVFRLCTISNHPPKLSSEIIFDSSDTENLLEILEIIKSMTEEQKAFFTPNSINLFLNSAMEFNRILSGHKIILFTNQSSMLNYEQILINHHNFTVTIFTTENTKTAENNSLHKISFFTGGKIFDYSEKEVGDIFVDLMNVCYSDTVYNVQIYLRTSDKIIKDDVLAVTINPSLYCLELNSMVETSTVSYNLCLSLDKANKSFVQAEVRFIDSDGCQRIRIFNHGFDHTTDYFKTISVENVFYCMLKLHLDSNIDYNIDNNLCSILGNYQKNNKNLAGKLLLPESLKLLPVLVQALSKMQLKNIYFFSTANTEQAIKTYYPRLFLLSDYLLNGKIAGLRLTRSSIVKGEIYVLENSSEIIFYLDKGVDDLLVSNMFSSLDVLDEGIATEHSFNGLTEEGRLCLQLIEEIQGHYRYSLHIRIFSHGRPLDEAKFFSNMIEDAIQGHPKFFDYLCQLYHRLKL